MTGRTGFAAFLPVVLGYRWLSTLAIVHSKLGVKNLVDAAADIDAVRPKRCPACGAASAPVGRSLTIIGHGIRRRWLVWKTGVGNAVRRDTIWVRRFLCRACHATITVLPMVVEPRRRYALDAIVFCLAVWALEDTPAAGMRRLFCDEPHLDWPQLRRWARCMPLPEGRRVGRGPPKRCAGRVAQIYAGWAPPETREGHSLAQRAFEGAAYLKRKAWPF